MAEAPLILVVDDEQSYRDALRVALEREGFRVEVAVDGPDALERFDAVRPGLVLLDVMLPRISGVDVCRQIRAKSHVPIIMVTARNAEIDAVVGLEVGADDYVTKPFRLRELVARVRAALRRGRADESRNTVMSSKWGTCGSTPRVTK
jgi:two-component system response regulator RegX3